MGEAPAGEAPGAETHASSIVVRPGRVGRPWASHPDLNGLPLGDASGLFVDRRRREAGGGYVDTRIGISRGDTLPLRYYSLWQQVRDQTVGDRGEDRAHETQGHVRGGIPCGHGRGPARRRGGGRVLEQARKEFDDLPERKRWEFDQERLVNPYADTRILYGDPDTEVSSILVGIDLEVGEVLLADRLREKGQSRRPDAGPPPRRPGAGPPGRGHGAAGRRVAQVRSVDRLRRRGHERAHGRDHAGPASPQQRADGAGGAPPRYPVHVLPHSRRQQRQRLRAGALRRTGHRRHGRRTARHAEEHPRVPAGGARGDGPDHLRGRRQSGARARSWWT